jgi:GNAT superfamily N-acetyltransferase
MLIEQLIAKDVSSAALLLPPMWLLHTESELISKEKLKAMSALDYVKKGLKSKNQVFFVAKIDEQIIGIIRCEIKPAPHYYHEKKTAFLDDLIVIEKYRKQGIATALIKEAIMWAQQKQTRLFCGKIWEFNKPSAKLFKKLGFTRTFSFYHRED